MIFCTKFVKKNTYPPAASVSLNWQGPNPKYLGKKLFFGKTWLGNVLSSLKPSKYVNFNKNFYRGRIWVKHKELKKKRVLFIAFQEYHWLTFLRSQNDIISPIFVLQVTCFTTSIKKKVLVELTRNEFHCKKSFIYPLLIWIFLGPTLYLS